VPSLVFIQQISLPYLLHVVECLARKAGVSEHNLIDFLPSVELGFFLCVLEGRLVENGRASEKLILVILEIAEAHAFGLSSLEQLKRSSLDDLVYHLIGFLDPLQSLPA